MKLTIDRTLATIHTDTSWQFGIGNDHAFQLLRKDVCEHIQRIHDELGFKYLRFHGILDDDLLTYQRLHDYRAFRGLPFNKQIHEVNFRHVGQVFDNVLACGMKPFVELSFMPLALASGKKVGLRYKNNITMPKSLTKWEEYIESFIRFLLIRYGKDEVETWFFEVWNEPDLSIFFKGSQNDYFKLYASTVKAIKKVLPSLRVGGPSTSACRWIEDFVSYCKQKDVPYDFVTTHHYPGDAFGNMISIKDGLDIMRLSSKAAKENIPLGQTLTDFFFRPEKFKHWSKGIFQAMDQKAASATGGKPLLITEWNSMAVFAAPVHDEPFNAAFVAKTVLDLDHTLAGTMFWCASDLFEEMFMLGKPFVGSYGIVTNDGIPKPSFWAFKLLSTLYPQRLLLPKTNDQDVEYAVFIQEDKTQIMFVSQDQDYHKHKETEIELVINTVATHVTEMRIDDTYGNPKRLWLDMGKPDHLTSKEVETIKEKSRLVEHPLPFEVYEGQTLIRMKIKTNHVVLLHIE